MMDKLRVAVTAAVGAVTLYACSSLPERIETLEQARSAVAAARREPLAREAARSPFERAQAELERANQAYDERADLEIVEHHAYLALRNAQIVEQLVAEQQARNELAQGEVERQRVQLQAREREAAGAQRAAEQAQLQAEAAETLAEQRAATIEQQTEQAREAGERTAALEQQLQELQAEQTERGLVLTLGDVLFDTDRAVLNAGAEPALQRLAEFMRQYPDRRILVEGHTDSLGSAEYNRTLSQQRADAVRVALLERRVATDRIETRALGEDFPVATNDTTAGRQLNRRVEIVISDQGGEFVLPTERIASP